MCVPAAEWVTDTECVGRITSYSRVQTHYSMSVSESRSSFHWVTCCTESELLYVTQSGLQQMASWVESVGRAQRVLRSLPLIASPKLCTQLFLNTLMCHPVSGTRAREQRSEPALSLFHEVHGAHAEDVPLGCCTEQE